MSKTVDSLRKSPFSEEVLYDQIANTYFSPKSRQKSRKKKAKTHHNNPKFLLWAAGLILLTALTTWIFLSQNRVPDNLAARLAKIKILKLVDGGVTNRFFVKRVEFRGNAKTDSRFLRRCIILSNSKKYNWADLSFDFKCPIDLSDRLMSLWLKGAVGGEKVSLVLKDVNNRSLRSDSIYLSSTWRAENIPLGEGKSDIDLSKITHVRLECGYVGESPKEMDSPIKLTIQIKDIKLTKKEI